MMDDEDIEKKFATIEKDFRALCANPTELKETTEKFFDIMLDELTLEVIFEAHRSAKIGVTEAEEDQSIEEEVLVPGGTDPDMYKQAVKKSQDCTHCTCPVCNRTVVASRFAPHLETCMGMGRKRSRNASRMVANNNNKERETSYGGMASDDEDDAGWNSGGKRKKKKTNNSRIKKSKTSPKKNGDANLELSALSYEHMNDDEKKALLTKFCGVVSEHTKKICSRSLRCNLHSDEKRRALRTALICEDPPDLVNVDVEGDDDIDNASLRDLLQDVSSTSSPADSASNSNSSTSSKKRDKTPKLKTKGAKKDRSSPSVHLAND